ncbi:hypothetical protein B0T18DRAFT_180408 [Schizothecium vesticola]|uniref:Uncharacterized protein n=1 Tax=Schizothecium vesticola TaxID=314040 RepID=A0AA40EPY6_9PEZI|nr:hypothetical protein B0T18DRAFT_180408 [Schizothecium vesticola]
MRGSCRCGASYRHVPPGLQARPACHHEPDTKGTLVANNLSKTSSGIRPFLTHQEDVSPINIHAPSITRYTCAKPCQYRKGPLVAASCFSTTRRASSTFRPSSSRAPSGLSPGGGLGPQKCSSQGKGRTQEGGVKRIRADTTARQVTTPPIPRPLSVPLSNLRQHFAELRCEQSPQLQPVVLLASHLPISGGRATLGARCSTGGGWS